MGPVGPSMDQTADLWLKIDQFHLNYLKCDENSKKIDIRKKLEGDYISTFKIIRPVFLQKLTGRTNQALGIIMKC